MFVFRLLAAWALFMLSIVVPPLLLFSVPLLIWELRRSFREFAKIRRSPHDRYIEQLKRELDR